MSRLHPSDLLALFVLLTPLSANAGGIPKGSTWWWQISNRPSGGHREKVIDFDPGLYADRAGPDPLVQQYVSSGHEVICYFSAGSYEDWREDASKIPSAGRGSQMDGWNERWLDTRNAGVRAVMVARIMRAKKLGCTGVEPDNVDGFSNSTGFSLSKSDSLNFLQFLAQTAHGVGLKIALKNTPELAGTLAGTFDFALVEECAKFGECGSYTPFTQAGKAVLQAEYMGYSDSVCNAAKQRGFSLLFFQSGKELNGNGVRACK